jgi:hypothetical protein
MNKKKKDMLKWMIPSAVMVLIIVFGIFIFSHKSDEIIKNNLVVPVCDVSKNSVYQNPLSISMSDDLYSAMYIVDGGQVESPLIDSDYYSNIYFSSPNDADISCILDSDGHSVDEISFNSPFTPINYNIPQFYHEDALMGSMDIERIDFSKENVVTVKRLIAVSPKSGKSLNGTTVKISCFVKTCYSEYNETFYDIGNFYPKYSSMSTFKVSFK